MIAIVAVLGAAGQPIWKYCTWVAPGTWNEPAWALNGARWVEETLGGSHSGAPDEYAAPLAVSIAVSAWTTRYHPVANRYYPAAGMDEPHWHVEERATIYSVAEGGASKTDVASIRSALGTLNLGVFCALETKNNAGLGSALGGDWRLGFEQSRFACWKRVTS
ncbi:MAG: hypothetical protein LBM66_07950 [Bifidobacteriaceae bacterium]|jgi:hypothetical protein|nr:hypothetical protein [Bifidobacteriaceae bacterium]